MNKSVLDWQAQTMGAPSDSTQPEGAESGEEGSSCPGTDEESEPKMAWELIIVDWENSGWYPEYWDFCFAVYAAGFRQNI